MLEITDLIQWSRKVIVYSNNQHIFAQYLKIYQLKNRLFPLTQIIQYYFNEKYLKTKEK